MSTYGLWLSAAGMKVTDHRQTVLTNNLANAETAGFKQDLAIVTQRRVESRSGPAGWTFAHPVLDNLSGGVHVRPAHYSTAQGPIHATGRPLDVAIQGEGFFTVSDGSVTLYTRDGNFTVNLAGELVLSAGGGRWKVLDDTQNPVIVPEDGEPPRVGSDGSIRQGAGVLANLNVVHAEQPQTMRKVGENLFEASTEVKPVRPQLVPESLEGSNSDVMSGLAQMIEASRVYEMNANLLRLQDEATGHAISRVGRAA